MLVWTLRDSLLAVVFTLFGALGILTWLLNAYSRYRGWRRKDGDDSD